jgi:hypothetical protein
MTYPVFASGDVLNAADMNGVGLWLVKSQTIGTGVSSVTVTDAFSSQYTNYKILVAGGSSTTDNSISMRLGSTTANYYYAMVYGNYTGGSAVANVNNGAGWTFAGTNSANGNNVNLDIIRPFESARTAISGLYVGPWTGGVNGAFGGFLNDASSYTAFTLTAGGGGTMTGGVIYVYGYRN